ncbi:MAG: ROK family protein [Aerococcus sp.]|nr:ROK family protein [Aerococcus sp.]
MTVLAVIDVGGTAIKYGKYNVTDQKLTDQQQVPTPDTLEDFYNVVSDIVSEISRDCTLKGVAFSMPGTYQASTGIIGGISAVPYIHQFPIRQALEERLKLPVSIENDANCAALAEVASGSAESLSNIVFIVIGTGVGGAIVLNRQIIPGAHSMAGEFGYMIDSTNQLLSQRATVFHATERYAQQTGKMITGEKLLNDVRMGDEIAIAETGKMYRSLAQTIFNLQYTIDPEAFIIGGGASRNPQFIDALNQSILEIIDDYPEETQVVPVVKAAKYANDANLIGAAYRYLHQK